jgi:hypothetical protein
MHIGAVKDSAGDHSTWESISGTPRLTFDRPAPGAHGLLRLITNSRPQRQSRTVLGRSRRHGGVDVVPSPIGHQPDLCSITPHGDLEGLFRPVSNANNKIANSVLEALSRPMSNFWFVLEWGNS